VADFSPCRNWDLTFSSYHQQGSNL